MDSLFESIKPFGKFQKINMSFLGGVGLVAALHFYVQIFNMAEPKFTCEPNIKVDDDAQMKNSKAPVIKDKCEMWQNSSAYTCRFSDPNYNLTAVNALGLVCDKSALIFHSQTIFFVGSICILFNGFLNDRFGRKRVCTVFLILISVFNLVYQAVVVDANALGAYFTLDVNARFLLYCVYQFLTGLFVYSLFSTAYVIAIEFTTHEYHTLAANLVLLYFILGEIILLIVFYLTRNWIHTNWFITATTICLATVFIRFVPESPRWLAEVGRLDEAYEILTRMAKTNQMNEFKQVYPTLESMSQLVTPPKSKLALSIAEKEPNPTLSIFWPMRNLVKLAGVFLIWNSINLNYSGVTLGIISSIDVNPFLMFLLAAVFEALGLLTCLANDRFGRRRTLFTQLVLVSVCSLLVSFLPDNNTDNIEKQLTWFTYAKVSFALIARGLISGAYNTIYIFASELYPVRIRSTALLFLSSGGCLSTLLAPQINMLRVFVWRPLPYIIYAASTLISSLIAFFLPETYKHRL